MNIKNIKRWVFLSALTMFTFACLNNLTAGITSKAKHSIESFFKEYPYLGLIANEISYGPITISSVNIHDGDKLAISSPGEKLKGSLRYKIDAKHLESLHLYHLVIGIKNEGAQDCVTHSFAMWDSKGKGKFTLTAPEKPGVYEVRFFFTDALTCDNAREAWNVNEPSSAATVGIIIVE